ncbi:uncharacterized protein LOC115768089 [Drosophila novamexicana]|uniref:Uncharacterized protein n=1 Tax=Drosophila virilis TaxID=7244 RepID=B4MGN7_DROVI|nr:uncharacterized protein LOC115768089 [Drosophila novamexicana]XP_032291499.1 uncharacterized protein LOC6636808 [Drosophila virilis]EDW57103.1 uncharacterized protein Dvir_GJ16055 [Drosophila virilis]
MGITNFFESVKNWTVARVQGTLSSKDDEREDVRRFPNLGEDIQQVVHTPEFEQVLDAASPFLLASMGAWPGYWLYRGFDYHSHRAHVPLPVYIRQTFYQAKLLQLLIIMTGIISMVKNHNNFRIFPVSNKD